MSLGIRGGFRFRDNGFGASGFKGVGFSRIIRVFGLGGAWP